MNQMNQINLECTLGFFGLQRNVLPLVLLILQLSDEIVQQAFSVLCRLLAKYLLNQLPIAWATEFKPINCVTLRLNAGQKNSELINQEETDLTVSHVSQLRD